jgi:GntR family transcriptional regulator
MLVFHLDTRANVAPYVQLVQQVKHALRLGTLRTGDQLPTVREVAAHLAINPNTVLRAYRELEHDGIIASRPGLGTFVQQAPPDASMAAYVALRQSLARWLRQARANELDDDSILALFATTLAESARLSEESEGGSENVGNVDTELHEGHLA